MTDKPVSEVPTIADLQDSDLLLGIDATTDFVGKYTISDAVRTRFNPNTGWFFLDGSIPDYQALSNDKYYVRGVDTTFIIRVPDSPSDGDSFTLYSESSNVFVQNASGFQVAETKPFSVLHLVWDGSEWVNFSEVASSQLSSDTRRAKIIVSGFTSSANGLSTEEVADRGKILSSGYVLFRIARNSDIEKAFRGEVIARNNTRVVKARFVDEFAHRAIVIARHPGQFIQGRTSDEVTNRGDEV